MTSRKTEDTVYGVVQGYYSDYRVLAVFTSKDRAEAYLEGVLGGDASIEEFSLNPEPNREIADFKKSGDFLFSVRMNVHTGNSKVGSPMHMHGSLYPYGYETVRMDTWGSVYYKDDELCPALVGTVRARDVEEATKIFNEYRVRFIAQYDVEKTIEAARAEQPTLRREFSLEEILRRIQTTKD